MADMNLWGPALATGAGALSGYLTNQADADKTAAQKEAYLQALQYLQGQQGQSYNDVFGTEAGPNGTNFSQQAQLRAAAQEALARNLQAQKINNARGLQTDKDAQNAALLQNTRLANAQSQQSANTAMQAALRDRAINPNTVGKNIYNGNRNAQNVINAAVGGLQNNNINQIGQDTQLSGLGANYINSAQNTMNQYNVGRNQYNQAIAQLMANKPTGDGYSSGNAMLQSGLGALGPSLASYFQTTGGKK